MMEILTVSSNWIESLLNLRNTRFTGQFHLKSQSTFWVIHLCNGRISYASDQSTQKWQRRFLLHCPQLEKEKLFGKYLNHAALKDANDWEYHLLFSLVESLEIGKDQAVRVAWLTITEALYEFLESEQQTTEFYINDLELSDPPLILFDPKTVLAEIQGFAQIWQAADLPKNCFDLAPIFTKHTSASAYPSAITELLDGRHTLWDLAAKINQPPAEVAQLLIPKILSGEMELAEVSDEPAPTQQVLISSEAKALKSDFVVSKPEKRQSNNEHRSRHQNRQRRIALISLMFLSLLLTGGIFWLCQMRSRLTKSTVAVSVASPSTASPITASPTSPAPVIQLYNSMREVPNVPRGLYNYGGAIVFAPLRSQMVLDAITKAQPQFHLRYTDPPFSGPGSHKAVAMLISNQLSFAQSALPLSDSEYDRARNHGFNLLQVPIGIAGIVFYTSLSLNIPGLSLDQLQAIYTGKITNWNQVGGPDLPIVPIAFDPTNSSTINILLSNTGGINSMSRNLLATRDWTTAIRLTNQTPGGISFGSVASVKGQKTIRPIPLAKVQSTTYINPYDEQGQINSQAIKDGDYPLSYKIFVVIRQDGTPDEKAGVAYANLLLSAEGQKLIKQAGFVPLH